MIPALSYIRVSTKTQAETGNGLELQREANAATASLRGMTIVAECGDPGVSGTIEALDRPGFECLVAELIERGPMPVIVYSMDRLARTLTVQEAALAVLWKRGATVIAGNEEILASDPSDPIRTLLRQIIGAVAEFEHKTIVNRMSRGRKAARRTDPTRYIGGRTIPAGCTVVGGQLVATDELVKLVTGIRAKMKAGVPAHTAGKPHGLTGVQVKRRLETAERMGI
jgi:DNA invertase Pin-like site-specific DNA recombinase